MATNKDVVLNVGVQTTGADSLQALAADVQGVSDAAKSGAPAFGQLGAELDALQSKTTELRTAEAAARAEVAQQKRALDDQREALARLRVETDSAGKAESDYQTKVKALQVAILDSRAALREKQAALQSAANSAKASAAAESALTEKIQLSQAALARQAQQSGATAAASAQLAGTVKGLGDQLRAVQAVAGAAVGGTLLGGLIGELSQTADAFANLQGRIKLVVGDGPLLQSTFANVADIALATNANLEATGTLFYRVAQAAKSAGLSTQDATAQALALTRTVNQAMAISGASADEAHRAVVQLTQGLATGTLRAQDFHSVAEQAPGVLNAMAAGLGKTSGELKKMADAGELTTQVVTSALLSQSAAVEEQFSKLPATVGRAVANLRTSWALYIGEASKASGVSTTAAAAINTLAQNLGTLGDVLYSVGKAAVAYKAVKLAQEFASIATAAKAATAEVAALNAAQAGAAASTAGAAANMGKFAALLGGLKVFALVGVLTNLKEIGTAIGEGVARWAGYGKAIDELAASDKRAAEAAREAAQAHAAQAQAAQLAADKALGLSDAARKLVGDFNTVIKDGGEVTTALDGIQKAMKLSDLSGIANAGAALDALRQRGQITAAQVGDAWAGALKGVDLGLFAAQAQAAFDGSEQGARRLAAALDAVGIESLRRVGTSVQELQTGFSTASASAINDVDALAATLTDMGVKGSDASRAVGAALDGALSKANTERAVQAVIDRFQQLGAQGLISGDQLAQGLQKAKDKLDQIQPGVNSLSEALHTFGLKSQAELQQTADTFRAAWDRIRNSTTTPLADMARAFEQYKAAAIAANNGIIPSGLAVEEEILRMKLAAQDAGASMGDAFTAAGRGVDALAGRVTVATGALERFKGTFTSTTANGDLGQLREKSDKHALSADDLASAQAALKQARDNKALIDAMAKNSPGAVSSAAITTSQADATDAQRLLAIVQGMVQVADKSKGGAAGSAATPGAAGGTGARTVNINIGGRNTPINVASQADSDQLVGLLRQLETAAGRAA
ncbi:MAG: hypothetical protein OJF60_002195 [Burkholderiaceae bacterium]|jgi:tape measure domain-containing protein|nr:MAG: hypothetical protein OJF60_002195 [Burkholderiaceae bacterium]